MIGATSERPGLYFRWFAKRATQICGGIVRNEISYRRILHALRTWDLYVGMNPANTWRKLKVSDADIAEIIGLVVDIDPITPRMPPEGVESYALDAIETVLGRLPHSIVVSTGRGLQVWLKVQFHILNSSEDRLAWRYATKQFIQAVARHFDFTTGYRVDTSCSDLSRLIRAIGSTNQKNGRTVQAISQHQFLPIQPTNFLERYPFIPEPLAPPAHPTGAWWKSFHLLSGTAKDFLVDGVSEPGRHAACYAAAASLRDVGVEPPIAERLISKGALLCSPPLPIHDALRACSNAYKGGPPCVTKSNLARSNP